MPKQRHLLLALLLGAALSSHGTHALRRAPTEWSRRLRQAAGAAAASGFPTPEAQQKQHRTLVVFGDSLSDTGNLLNITQGLLPSRRTYWRGRFSDGPVWVDHLAADPRVTTTVHNYAVGGATACGGIISALPDLRAQIDLFLSGAPGASRQTSQQGTGPRAQLPPQQQQAQPTAAKNLLMVVWIGHNDFLLSPDGLDMSPQQAAQLIRNMMACWEAGLDHLLTTLELRAAAASAASDVAAVAAAQPANGTGGATAAPLAREWKMLKGAGGGGGGGSGSGTAGGGGSGGGATGSAAVQRKLQVVVWSLAPVEIAPGVEPSLKPLVREAVMQANAALLASVESLRARHPSVVLDVFDAHAAISSSFAVARTELGFRNVTGPCLVPPPAQSQQARSMGGGGEPMGGAQQAKCSNPAEYVWYDELHPTSRAQRLTVAQPFQEFLVAKRR